MAVITANVIDSLEFDTTFCDNPDVIHISGDVYAAVYRGNNNDGWIVTFSVTSAGVISAAIINSRKFISADLHWTSTPKILHVSGTIYAITVGRDSDNHYVCYTWSIANDGTIAAAQTAFLDLAATSAYPVFVTGAQSVFIHISGTVYAIAYSGQGADGFVSTFTITALGAIGAIIDSLEYATSLGVPKKILNVSGTVYAIADEGYDGTYYILVYTVGINADGQIDDVVIDKEGISSDSSDISVDMCLVTGDVYAVVYQGGPGVADNTGVITTIEIPPSGAITDTPLDTSQFDTYYADNIRIILMEANKVGIAYEPIGVAGVRGRFLWMTVSDAGLISGNPAGLGVDGDSVAFESSNCDYPLVLERDTDIFIIIYQGTGNDGFVLTLTPVEEVPAAGGIVPIMMELVLG